jgi:uncharacterized membrane protein
MWWIVAGVALGAVAGGFVGAIGGAVIGAFACLIAHGMRMRSEEGTKPERKALSVTRSSAIDRRLDEIEARLARLETGLAVLRGQGVPASPAPLEPEHEPVSAAPPPIPAPSLAPPIVPLEAPAPIPAPYAAIESTPPPLPDEQRDALAEVLRRAEAAPSDRTFEEAPGVPPAGEPAPRAIEPAEEAPSWWERLASGNIVAKVGSVILFFGVAFLLKYA